MSIRSGSAGALGTTADDNRPLKTDKNKEFPLPIHDSSRSRIAR